MKRLVVVLAVLVAACSGGASPGSPAPAGGTVTGQLVSQRSDGSGRAPVGGERVGAFTRTVIPGKPLQHPAAPVTTGVTGADGSFRLHGLKPGRYFITVAGARPAVAGQWVTVTASRGATVLLIHCTNCPGPL